MGNVLCDLQHCVESIGSYRRAIELQPRFAEAHNNLAGAVASTGLRDDADDEPFSL